MLAKAKFIIYIKQDAENGTQTLSLLYCVGLKVKMGGEKVKEILVKVYDNDVEKAIRILKKKIQNDGLFKRLKMKKTYEKPSEYRRRKQREAQRRERIAVARARRRNA